MRRSSMNLPTLRRVLLLTDPLDALGLKLRAEGDLVRGMALRILLHNLLCTPQALRGARNLCTLNLGRCL